jgi:hypothetical protein
LISRFAFPDDELFPTRAVKSDAHLGVPLYVAGELPGPEVEIALWGVGQMATGVSVPVAAMNINGCSILRKNDVGFAGNVLTIQTKAIAQPVQQRPHQNFRT